MRNWRSFHGDHEIEFSVDPARPVTLLLGPNGAGKTALLNAFTWAIYGEFTEGFDHPDRLVNLAAVDVSENAETFVDVHLQHEGNDYRVKRSTNAQQQITGEYVLVITKNGERTVEADIHRILPRPLKDLFFLPAETFSTASVLKGENGSEEASFDVRDAIRSLLSGDIYRNASKNLREAIQSDTLKPPKKGHGQEAVESAHRQYEQAESMLSSAEERKDKLPELYAAASQQADRAKQEAERYDPKEIQRWSNENKRLSKQVADAEQLEKKANALYVDLTRSSHLYFAEYGVELAIRRLNQAEEAGLMPPRVHESVLDKTLESGQCSLCHSPLNDTSRERVTMLRERVGDAQVAVRGLEARTMLKQFLKRNATEIDRLREEIADLASSLQTAPPPIDAGFKILAGVMRTCISVADRLLRQAKLELEQFTKESIIDRPADGKSPVDIAIVAQQRFDLINEELSAMPEKIEALRKIRDAAFKDYREKSGKSDDHKQKSTAIEILQQAQSYFEAASQGLEEFGRADFEKAINETYADLIAKPFTIRVESDFSIRVLLSGTGETMPLSQSEKVLLLIAFLGAIARLAPHYEEIAKQREQFTATGSVETSKLTGFPVVLDAPTSPLDEQYEIDVVDALPNLLPQVIVPVSAKSVTVWERIADRIGRVYVMELTSNTASDRKVNWNGKDYTYSICDEQIVPARTRIAPLN
jgi:energy-coupling factor transporter ATP-binding protein EcfA2